MLTQANDWFLQDVFGGKIQRSQSAQGERRVHRRCEDQRRRTTIAAKYKGRVIDVYTEVFGGFAIELPASAVVAVSELPEVDVVTKVRLVW
ncbi:MAG: protease inhibitor I9 family protein [Thermoanaerobaculia bacterium]